MMLFWLSVTASLVAVAGCGFLLTATILVARAAASTAHPRAVTAPAVTVLKPLHGDEPGLLDNLGSFCSQDYPGPIQVVFGVQDPGDGAVAVVEHLRKIQAGQDLDLVIETKVYGLNRKVSNLVNMAPRIRHDVVVLADSDMRVDPDYLSRVTAALDEPGVGAVTCLYYGVPVAGMWSSLSALAINAHFLPGVVFGLALGLARPCFGSTLALRRQTLGEIGGFIAFVDCLADDYAMGAALRARGHTISIPPFGVARAGAYDFDTEVRRCPYVHRGIGVRFLAARVAMGTDDQEHRSARLCRFDPRPSAAMGADRRAARRRLDRIPAGDRHRAGVDRMPSRASAEGGEGICPASASVLACARA